MFGPPAESLKHLLACRHAQHKDAENNLQAESPQDGFNLDGATVGGESPGEGDDDSNAQNASEMCHAAPYGSPRTREKSGFLASLEMTAAPAPIRIQE